MLPTASVQIEILPRMPQVYFALISQVKYSRILNDLAIFGISWMCQLIMRKNYSSINQFSQFARNTMEYFVFVVN